MKSYRIYLTKSSEVAGLIAQANWACDGVYSVGHGPASSGEFIPKIYHDCGYFYCKVEFEESEHGKYEIVFA